MSDLTEAVVTIATAIIGLAIVATLVSKNANTTSVVQSLASGFNNSLAVAEGPVTGNTTAPVLAYPSSGFGGFSGMNDSLVGPYG